MQLKDSFVWYVDGLYVGKRNNNEDYNDNKQEIGDRLFDCGDAVPDGSENVHN